MERQPPPPPNPDDNLTPDEDLRADNELKKLNLETRFGAQHIEASDDLPPELMAQWLDNVTSYEEQYANAPKIPVWSFIGRPAYQPADALAEQQFEPEIKRIMGILQENFVLIEPPKHLSPRGFYRFLTEKFLHHEMTDHRAPGMMHFFSYDEFCHDGPEFIQDHVSDFIQDVIALDRPYEGIWLSENLRNDMDTITKTEAIAIIEAFRAQYTAIRPTQFAPVQVMPTPQGMYFMFHAEWEGDRMDTGETERFEGAGICQVGFEDGEWLVQGVNMPGFKF